MLLSHHTEARRNRSSNTTGAEVSKGTGNNSKFCCGSAHTYSMYTHSESYQQKRELLELLSVAEKRLTLTSRPDHERREEEPSDLVNNKLHFQSID